MVELYINCLTKGWIESGDRLEEDGVYSSANMNIVKHSKFHNEATQGSRYKYKPAQVWQARVESQHTDNPLCIAMRGSDVELRRVELNSNCLGW